VADHDAVNVTADDGVIPDAGVITERDIAKHDGAARDENAFAEGRLFAQKSSELFRRVAYAARLIRNVH
jgi:hypothetical protein